MNEPTKIILFLDKTKKSHLVYLNLDDLCKLKKPHEYSKMPLTKLNEIKEQWIIKKVVSSNSQLSLEFEKLK